MGNKDNIFGSRKEIAKGVRRDASDLFRSTDSRPVEENTSKSLVYYQSKIDGYLVEKAANENKAATLVAECLNDRSMSAKSENDLVRIINDLLKGFDSEEKVRILTKALVIKFRMI